MTGGGLVDAVFQRIGIQLLDVFQRRLGDLVLRVGIIAGNHADPVPLDRLKPRRGPPLAVDGINFREGAFLGENVGRYSFAAQLQHQPVGGLVGVLQLLLFFAAQTGGKAGDHDHPGPVLLGETVGLSRHGLDLGGFHRSGSRRQECAQHPNQN